MMLLSFYLVTGNRQDNRKGLVPHLEHLSDQQTSSRHESVLGIRNHLNRDNIMMKPDNFQGNAVQIFLAVSTYMWLRSFAILMTESQL